MPGIPNIDWAKLLSSKAFENVAAVGGSLLQAKGAADAQDRAMNAAGQRDMASILTDLQNAEQDRSQRAAAGVLEASPLGANQQYAAANRVRQALLGGMQNFSITPGDPEVAAAMPRMEGGFRLPEGGIGREVLDSYGPEATAAAIAERAKLLNNLDPTASGPDFAALGFGPELAGRHTAGVAAHATQRLSDQTAATASKHAQIMEALRSAQTPGSPGNPKEDTPWWKKALKYAAIAAPIVAAPFTFGASAALSPAAAAAIGAGASVAGRVGNSSSPTRRQNPYSGVNFGA